VAKHGSRLVKTTGDSVLLEFPSVVDAVKWTVAVQVVMAERNTGVPENRRMLYRTSSDTLGSIFEVEGRTRVAGARLSVWDPNYCGGWATALKRDGEHRDSAQGNANYRPRLRALKHVGDGLGMPLTAARRGDAPSIQRLQRFGFMDVLRLKPRKPCQK
jgi:hypothetical protein